MTKDEALKLALEALHKGKVACEWGQAHDHVQQIVQAMEAIKQVLAQLEQDDGMCTACENNLCTAKQGCVALENPPQRTWVGLTDEDVKAVNAQVSQIPPIDYTTTTYAKAIEAKLKEKNT